MPRPYAYRLPCPVYFYAICVFSEMFEILSAHQQEQCVIYRMFEDQEDTDEAVAARLRAVREVLGLSKKEFSEKAGISEQVYGPYENARRPLSLESAKKLRKTYSLSLEFMYFGKMDDLPTRLSRALSDRP